MVLYKQSGKLSYKNVALKPRRSEIRSRADVDLSRTFKFPYSGQECHGIPIMAANMDTVGTFEMAIALAASKAFTAIHKYYSVEAWKEFAAEHPECMPYVILTSGTSNQDQERMCRILDTVKSVKFVMIDTLESNSQDFVEQLRNVRLQYPNHTLIAGSVADWQLMEEMIITARVDAIKIGMSMSSTSTGRKKTGCGFPSISNILECANAAHAYNVRVIASGGCACPGDVAKAMAAGADFVMLGGLLAGHEECGGELIIRRGRKYKLFYDMSSTTAMKKHVGCVTTYRGSEGRTVEVPYKGAVHNTLLNICDGLRSACTYVGCHKLKELTKRATFIPLSDHHGSFIHSFQSKGRN